MTRREGEQLIQGIRSAVCENQHESVNLQFSRPKTFHMLRDSDLKEENIGRKSGRNEIVLQDQLTLKESGQNSEAKSDEIFDIEDCKTVRSSSGCEQSPLFASSTTNDKVEEISEQNLIYNENSKNNIVVSNGEKGQNKSKRIGDLRRLNETTTRLKWDQKCKNSCETSTRAKTVERNFKAEGEDFLTVKNNTDNPKIDCALKIGQVSKAQVTAGVCSGNSEEEIEIDVIGEEGILLYNSASDLLNCPEMNGSLVETNTLSKNDLNKELTNKDSISPEAFVDGDTCRISEVPVARQDGALTTKISKQLDSKECQNLEVKYGIKESDDTRNSLAANVGMLLNDSPSLSIVEQENAINQLQLDLSLPMDEDMESNGDGYNRFYFESDNLALKGNEHYHILLQTLVALESQRIQSIKDLELLATKQRTALEDPIGFVEKLQNNEPLGLPTRQAVVKLPQIPWGEYVTSLDSLDRHCFPFQHQTRKIAQQLEKNVLSAQQQESSSESSATVDSQRPSLNSMGGTNAYSVFGGDFVANKHGKSLDRESYLAGCAKGLPGDAKYIRGRPYDSSKPATFNQPWTAEEQAKLERLLQIFPQEEVESKRWEKIAKALGNRTTKQVASRVQKYFIKLAKASLPVPGRMPNVPKLGVRSRRSSHYQTLSFRNSTFFPNYQPRVYMDDDQDQDTANSELSADTSSAYPSDDELVPEDLKGSDDYKELLQLKRLKRMKMQKDECKGKQAVHQGYMCDGCGVDPIRGTRWHCIDCPDESSVDFCFVCVQREIRETKTHKRMHTLEAINRAPSYFMDGDYMELSGTSNGYNYLDPNFLPAAS